MSSEFKVEKFEKKQKENEGVSVRWVGAAKEAGGARGQQKDGGKYTHQSPHELTASDISRYARRCISQL